MATEKVVNEPFDSSEIVEIAVEEFRKRLKGLSPLYGNKQYRAFTLNFNVGILLTQVDHATIPTLAWGDVSKGEPGQKADAEDKLKNDVFVSLDPNDERIARDMPLTVESPDGRRGITRRKVNVRDSGREKHYAGE